MPWTLYSEIYRAVRNLNLTTKRICSLVAHIERYPAFIERKAEDELIETGAKNANVELLQTCRGKWYAEITRWCRKMLKENKIHFYQQICTI